MPEFKPDVPLSLGAHLDELRRRLMWPILFGAVCFFVAFVYESELKKLFIQPLLIAKEMAEAKQPGSVAKAGLVCPPGEEMRLLKTFSMFESMMTSMTLALWAALVVTIPLLLFQIYQFVAVGLKANERRLAFLFVPVAVICFYIGAVFGYYWGMPFFFAWFITWSASDPIASFDLRLESYRDAFLFYTIAFGVAADLPWAVVVLCRVGLVKVGTLAKARRIIFMATTVIAAVIAPGDFFSMIVMMFGLYGLFEIGLFAAWLVGGPKSAVTAASRA